jgi:hypothetical protein
LAAGQRTFAGVGELRQFLEHAGISADRIAPVLRQAQHGNPTRIET